MDHGQRNYNSGREMFFFGGGMLFQDILFVDLKQLEANLKAVAGDHLER